ncbi:hypothetical protein ACUXP2_002291, partial [Staphylococcus haemolyticus]
VKRELGFVLMALNIRKVVAQRAENNQKIYKKRQFLYYFNRNCLFFTYPRTLCPGLLFIYNLYKILLINIYFNIKLQHLILVQMFHNEYDFDQHLMLLILQ